MFRDVSIFDRETMLRHRDVIVRGNVITAINEAGTMELTADALVLSGDGKTLLPGLVDSHAHLFSAGQKEGTPPSPEAIAEAFLYAGVTTASSPARHSITRYERS